MGTNTQDVVQSIKKERKVIVISEVLKMEKESYKIRTVSQQRQGRWTTWEAVINKQGGEQSPIQ